MPFVSKQDILGIENKLWSKLKTLLLFPWRLQISVDNSKSQHGPRATVGRLKVVSEPSRKRQVPIRLQEEAEIPLVRYIYTHTQCMRECNPG